MHRYLPALLLIALLSDCIPVFSQVITFQNTALFNRHNTGYSILSVPDTANSEDRYLMAGTLMNPNLSDSLDFHVLFAEGNGNILWERFYNTGKNERCLNVAQSPDGYILTGFADTGSTNHQMVLLEIDPGGNILQQKRYESPFTGHTQGLSVKATQDTGFVVTGFLNDGYNNTDNKRSFILKTDSLLNPVWSKYFSTPWDITRDLDMGECVIEIPGTGFFITGSVNIKKYNPNQIYNSTDQGVLAIMVDLNGNLLWNSSFSAQDSSETGHWNVGVKSYFDSGSNLIYLMSNNTQTHQFAITVFDLAGNIVNHWDYNFLLNGIAGYDLIESANPNTLIACGVSIHYGFMEGNNFYSSNFPPVLLEFNKSDGTQVWSRMYKVPSEYYAGFDNGFYTPNSGIQPQLFTPDMAIKAGDDGYAIAAYRSNFSSYYDLELIKTDATGKTPCPFDTLQFSPFDYTRYISDSVEITSGFTAAPITFQKDSIIYITDFCAPPDTCFCDFEAGFSYATTDSCTFQFNDTSSVDTCYSICQWEWDFGDSNTSNLQNPTHTYDTIGWQSVCLRAYACGPQGIPTCDTIFCQNIYVECDTCNCEIEPIFSFSTNDNCTYQFTDGSIVDTACYDLCIWNWDFGDGNFSSAQNPTHTFNVNGPDTVCLTVFACQEPGMISCDSTYCHIFNLSCLQVGMEEASEITAEVYPNPFSNTTSIVFSRALVYGHFELFDISGKKVAEQIVDGKSMVFHRKDQPPGNYSFVISENGKIVYRSQMAIR